METFVFNVGSYCQLEGYQKNQLESCWKLLGKLMMLQRSDQLAQSRRHDDEVPRWADGFIIRVGNSSRHEHSGSRRGLNGVVARRRMKQHAFLAFRSLRIPPVINRYQRHQCNQLHVSPSNSKSGIDNTVPQGTH